MICGNEGTGAFGIRFGPVSGLSGFGLITAMEINIHEINKINEIEVGLVMIKAVKIIVKRP